MANLKAKNLAASDRHQFCLTQRGANAENRFKPFFRSLRRFTYMRKLIVRFYVIHYRAVLGLNRTLRPLLHPALYRG